MEKYKDYTVKELRDELARRQPMANGTARQMSKQVLIDRLAQDDITKTNLFPYYIRGIDEQILLTLSDEDLSGACGVNRYVDEICRSNNFWRLKLSRYMGMELRDSIDYRTAYTKILDYTNNVEWDYITTTGNGYIRQPMSDMDKWYRIAAMDGYLEIIKSLSPYVKDYTIDVALRWAAAFDQLPIVKYILDTQEERLDKMEVIGIRYDLARWQSLYGHKKFLIYDDYEDEDKMLFIHDSPLSWASAAGNLEVLDYLISRGYDINAVYLFSSRGSATGNILADAAFAGQTEVIYYLIEADINHDFYHNALYYAALGGHLDIVKYLTSLGADINNIQDGLYNILQKFDKIPYPHVEEIKHHLLNEDLPDALVAIRHLLATTEYGRYGEIILYLIQHGARYNWEAEEIMRYSSYIPLKNYILRRMALDPPWFDVIIRFTDRAALVDIVLYLIKLARELNIGPINFYMAIKRILKTNLAKVIDAFADIGIDITQY